MIIMIIIIITKIMILMKILSTATVSEHLRAISTFGKTDLPSLNTIIAFRWMAMVMVMAMVIVIVMVMVMVMVMESS